MNTKASPRSRGPQAILLAAALLGLVAFARPARGGWDDFEFGQRLIAKGHIAYARRVFERILADDKRSAADKDRAKYGMALLGKADVIASARNPKTPWKDLVAKMGEAIQSIEDFVQKNPQDPKADEARFESASLRLWFVDWASRQAQDKEALEARGATANDMLEAARKQIEAAIATFEALKTGAKKEADKEIAQYQFVTATYFKGLVYEKCSPSARSAFETALKVLEDYATEKDGYLTSAFAVDYLGQTCRELGDCEDGDKRWKRYNEALAWFVSAAATEDQGDDHRKVMTLGYLHIGQLANHVAGEKPPVTDPKAREVLKQARKHLQEMLQRAPRANKMESGVLALVELGLIEWKLENGPAAIEVLRKASDFAQAAGLDAARNRANAVLTQVVAGGGASSAATAVAADPSVVFKVAEDLFNRGKWAEAIGAYQQVIVSAPKTGQGLKDYVYPSWSKIASSYQNMKLYLEAATALDVLMDEVRSGRIIGAGEGDRTTRLASDSMSKIRLLLKELMDRTGEAAWRERFNKWVEEEMRLRPLLKLDSSTGADLAYRRARDLFDEARRLKEDKPGAAEWKKLLQDSRPFFADTSKSPKSEWQDVSFVYLARIAYELGEWDGVQKAADDAAAWWASPEGKRRYDEDEKIRGARKVREGELEYWRAAAHRGAGRLADALKLLEGYKERFGKVVGDYYRGQALGMRVEILAEMQRFDDAEKAFEDLVREIPDYYRMGAILILLADHHQKAVNEVQKKIDAVDREWLGPPEDRAQGAKSRLAAAERAEAALVATLSDLNQTISRMALQLMDPDLPSKEKERILEDSEKRKVQRVTTQEALKKTRDDIAQLSKRRDELAAQRLALAREQMPPMRKATELYRRLDDILKDLDKAGGGATRRKSENVASLAYRYLVLARLAPDQPDDWVRARDLYEDYLSFADVKALPEGNEAKRRTLRFLGEIYDRMASFAEAEGKADEARAAYANAVRCLQPTVARIPANVPLVVANLAGEVAVLPYQDPVTGRRWPIPVRKVANVKDLREYVKALGGDRLPKYAADSTDRAYQQAVKTFQAKIAEMTDEQLNGTVSSLKNAGFDVLFFADFGYPETEYLLTLARAYARCGVAENAMRAVGAARAVNEVPPKAEEESAEWWAAQTILLEVLVGMAERGSAGAGAQSGDAKTRALEADRHIDAIKRTHPLIGGSERHAKTLKEWKALQARLAKVMQGLGLTPTPVDLDAPPPTAEIPPEPAPAAPPAAPPAPAPAMGDGK